MLTRRTALALLASMAIAMPLAANAADGPLKVVATFSILGDMTKVIGGDAISVTTLVGPDGDAHVYEPTPADAQALGAASVLISNGLGFESWLPRLLDASGFAGTTVVASTGVTPREFAGEADEHEHADASGHETDPHAWQDLANGVIYARNIGAALAAADPAHASGYQSRANTYIAQLEALNAKVKTAFAALPTERRKVVTTHDAFGYFGAAYGVSFIAPEGMSTESEASAADVARIIDQVREDGISAVFVENISNPRLLEQIARETGASVGGALYSDALSAADGPAATYVAMFEWNTAQLTKALAPNS